MIAESLRAAWRCVVVEGDSMAPTVRAGDLLLINAQAPRTRGLQRGSIVAWSPMAGRAPLLKRVVGLPGETVVCRGGAVWVEGAPLREPYAIRRTAGGAVHRWSLAPAEYLLLGDRRDDSLDSRRLGPARQSDVVGVLRYRVWPLVRRAVA